MDDWAVSSEDEPDDEDPDAGTSISVYLIE